VPLPFDPIARAAEKWRERWGEGAPAAPMAAATSIMRVQQLLLARFDAIAAEERLMVHPTSATNIIQRLAASGFVERLPNPADGRGTLARITPRGVAAMEAVTMALHESDFGLGDLTDAQTSALTAVLRTVRLGAGDFEQTGEP
jgi:DNA-binding MarR family transcriptional regulator